MLYLPRNSCWERKSQLKQNYTRFNQIKACSSLVWHYLLPWETTPNQKKKYKSFVPQFLRKWLRHNIWQQCESVMCFRFWLLTRLLPVKQHCLCVPPPYKLLAPVSQAQVSHLPTFKKDFWRFTRFPLSFACVLISCILVRQYHTGQ